MRLPALFVLLACAILSAQPRRGSATIRELSGAFEELTRQVSPAVVQIFVSGMGFATDSEAATAGMVPRQTASGSGVIVDADGYLVTNAHVVEGAQKVVVALARSLRAPRPLLDARVVGVDKELDLAVLKVDRTTLPVIPFGNSDQVREGQLVLALGSPMGLQNSITMGVVSASSRYLDEDDLVPYIQTDAPINPGNSGGPLVNVDGQLIGVNTFILSQSGGNEGVGFAIPSNIVRSTYQQLRRYGRIRRGEIGVHTENLNPVVAAGLGLPRESGVIAADVFPESAAEEAGVKVGDILLSLDGRPLEDARQFDLNLNHRSEGERVRLEVLRGTDKLEFSVAVSERAGEEDQFAEFAEPSKDLVDRLGVLCIPLDKKVMELLGPTRFPYGVVVAARAPDHPGQEVDLQPGDVIHSLNKQPVRSVEELRKMLGGMKSGGAVVLQVEREESLHYIAFRLE